MDISEVYSKQFCCQLFELKIGDYICLLAYKIGGSETYTIKTIITSENGLSISKMNMGLYTNKYRMVWSNEGNLALKKYKVIAVDCKRYVSYF
jgi:hypothetical protein